MCTGTLCVVHLQTFYYFIVISHILYQESIFVLLCLFTVISNHRISAHEHITVPYNVMRGVNFGPCPIEAQFENVGPLYIRGLLSVLSAVCKV